MSTRLVVLVTSASAIALFGAPMAFSQTAPSAGSAANQASSPETSLRSTIPVTTRTGKKGPDPYAIPGNSPTPAQPTPSGWSQQELAEAKAHCDAVLKGTDAVFETEQPIKQGACGAPAVVKLVSIGKSPAIALNPPAVLTCDMVVALGQWIKSDVQRSARANLGASIVKLEVMSSYSCRNAYGRSRTNLSEHGRANALDIGGFETAAHDATRVLTSWGPTGREMTALAKAEAARIESAKAAAAAAVAASKPANGQPVVTGSTTSAGTMPSSPKNGAYSHAGHGVFTNTPNVPGVVVRVPDAVGGSSPGFGFSQPSRLGGAKPNDTAKADAGKANGPKVVSPASAVSDERRKRFLHEIHAAACKYFGTVLGPEANRDHANHFHIDLAPRKTGNYCH